MRDNDTKKEGQTNLILGAILNSILRFPYIFLPILKVIIHIRNCLSDGIRLGAHKCESWLKNIVCQLSIFNSHLLPKVIENILYRSRTCYVLSKLVSGNWLWEYIRSGKISPRQIGIRFSLYAAPSVNDMLSNRSSEKMSVSNPSGSIHTKHELGWAHHPPRIVQSATDTPGQFYRP